MSQQIIFEDVSNIKYDVVRSIYTGVILFISTITMFYSYNMYFFDSVLSGIFSILFTNVGSTYSHLTYNRRLRTKDTNLSYYPEIFGINISHVCQFMSSILFLTSISLLIFGVTDEIESSIDYISVILLHGINFTMVCLMILVIGATCY